MQGFLNLLNGKKTYLVAIVAAATAAAQALGYTVPDWLYPIEGALGLGALRVAVTKS
ncbi:MAG TPA: hypothetical protein VNH44_08705 [Micropepsaceae bacterium]|nr:hypothetical protein [Micropepsaceae bacterium]